MRARATSRPTACCSLHLPARRASDFSSSRADRECVLRPSLSSSIRTDGTAHERGAITSATAQGHRLRNCDCRRGFHAHEDMLGSLLDALQGVKRLILVGDPAQLPPIGAADPSSISSPSFNLKTTRRGSRALLRATQNSPLSAARSVRYGRPSARAMVQRDASLGRRGRHLHRRR